MLESLLLMPAVASLLGFGHAFQLESRFSGRATASENANMTMETALFFPKYKSERVKIRYGPFTVPEMSVNNGMKDFRVAVAQKPCTDCLITWMQAGLEYPNGTIANANTGLWLHHTVFSNTQRTAIVCPQADSGDQFFASGNERTPVDICANGTDRAGYYIGPEDNLGFLIELMNMVEDSREAVLTMTWEYIPAVPSGFDKVKPLWLDIGGCGSSELPAKANQAFQYTSPAWVSNFTGRITWMGSHLHDGGTHLTIKKKNTVMCDCRAAYGQNPAYVDGGSLSMSSSMSMSKSGMDMGMTSSMDMPGMMSTTVKTKMGTSTEKIVSKTSTSIAMSTSTSMAAMNMSTDTVHISSISDCENMGTVGIGDELSITAYYNSSKYSLMTDSNGSLAPIMGIALLYVAEMNMTSTAANSSGNGAMGGAGQSSSSGALDSGASAISVLLWCGLMAGLLVIF